MPFQLNIVTIRPLMGVMLAYDRNELPSLSLLLPIKLLVWSLVLDFFFYWYHRLMHQVPALWKFHRSEWRLSAQARATLMDFFRCSASHEQAPVKRAFRIRRLGARALRLPAHPVRPHLVFSPQHSLICRRHSSRMITYGCLHRWFNFSYVLISSHHHNTY